MTLIRRGERNLWRRLRFDVPDGAGLNPSRKCDNGTFPGRGLQIYILIFLSGR